MKLYMLLVGMIIAGSCMAGTDLPIIANPNGQKMYIGVDNPIFINADDNFAGRLYFEVANGEIIEREKQYYLKVTEPGADCVVNLYAELPDNKYWCDKKVFNVRRLPWPDYFFTDQLDRSLTASQLRETTRLGLSYPVDTPMEYRSSVLNFRLTLKTPEKPTPQVFDIHGDTVPAEARKMIETMTPGSTLEVDRAQVVEAQTGMIIERTEKYIVTFNPKN